MNFAAQRPEFSKHRLHLVSSRPAHVHRNPLALWHLLSLDAPTVAAIWTVFLGWSAGVRVSASDGIAMFVAVWMLYAADRLLDARPLLTAPSAPDLEERHRFHHRHRARFLPLLAGATVPLALLLHRTAAPVLHLYILLASFLASWLLLVHAGSAPSANQRRLPKELAVGVFFPAAVFIPTVGRAPALRLALLPHALLFACLCTLNCLFLYAWEHPHSRRNAHASTRWLLRSLPELALCVIVISAAIGSLSAAVPYVRSHLHLAHPIAVPLACGISTSLLLLLHRRRHDIPSLRLRALADLVLLAPIPIVLGAALAKLLR